MRSLYIILLLGYFHQGSSQIVNLKTGKQFASALISEVTKKIVTENIQSVQVQRHNDGMGGFCDYSNVKITGLKQYTTSNDLSTIYQADITTVSGIYNFPSLKMEGDIECNAPNTTTSTGSFNIQASNIKWLITFNIDVRQFQLHLGTETFAPGINYTTMNNLEIDVDEDLYQELKDELQHILLETLNKLTGETDMCFNGAKRSVNQCTHNI